MVVTGVRPLLGGVVGLTGLTVIAVLGFLLLASAKTRPNLEKTQS